MEQHSAHNNTCKTQKFHCIANTQWPVQMLLGNAQWVVCFAFSNATLGMVDLILMGRRFQWGRGEPNCIHKWNLNFLNTT